MKSLPLAKKILRLHSLYGYNFRDVVPPLAGHYVQDGSAAGSNPVIPTLPAFISAEAGSYLK